MAATSKQEYLANVVSQLWDFAHSHYRDQPELLQTFERSSARAPVFTASKEDNNLLYPNGMPDTVNQAIATSLPKKERHRHFASMRSSQALAQSVFGALLALDKVSLLAHVVAEDDSSAFGALDGQCRVTLEYSVSHLAEPRPTSVDVWFEGEKRIAVECKFTETDFGRCSRPNLQPHRDNNYARDHCDGTYARQRDRQTRCSLTEVGIKYWDHVPGILAWPNDQDHRPCPLRGTYQLVRNVLAACVTPEGNIDIDGGHALIIYDARNPAFYDGGDADEQWKACLHALNDRRLLRRLSWQRLISQLRRDRDLDWLVSGLADKYGLTDDDA